MNEIEIYWKDLTKETQDRLLELWGENGNYDLIPIAVLPAQPEEEQQREQDLRILKIEPGQVPYEKTIPNTLGSIQHEVGGGLFEPVYLGDGVILCCNEEGKLNGMEMNRRLGEDIICGPFFLVGEGNDGNFTSLTDEQMNNYSTRFAEPEQFAEHEPDAQPYIEFHTF